MSLSSGLSTLSVFANKDLREPELHVIGEIIGASDLNVDNALCAWEVKTGKHWSCVGGETKGQTQVDYPEDGAHNFVAWNHPLDLHFYSKTIEGWPKIIFEVWTLDSFGNKNVTGYAFINVPLSPGCHEVETSLWRPVGNHREEMSEFFLGQVPQLLDIELLHNGAKAKEDRHRLTTTYAGKVHLRLDIVLRHIQDHGVRC